MLQFKFLTDQDRKEAAAIERRRRLEEERRKRIFNAKNRRIGVDVQALEKQIEEKQKQLEDQKRLEELFDQQRIQNDRLAVIYEKKEKEEKKRIEQEINNFRQIYQRIEDRREFDIYDPNALKKDLSSRLKDDDPRLGLASCQKFAGEDLASDERKKIIIEQQRAFLQQQIDEREAAERERKAAEEAYHAALMAQDKRATELDHLEQECRRRLKLANERFNRALASELCARRKDEEKNEIEDNHAEMYNTLMSDMMIENPDVSKSNLGPNRCIGFKYKGMTAEQRKAVREYQQRQAEENEKRKREEKEKERDWENYTLGVARTAENMVRENERKKRELDRRIASENLRLAQEQKAHMEYLDKVIYKNNLTASFFEQFNTSTR